MPSKPHSLNNDLNTVRGTSALALQAVQGITDLVEEMHGAISGLALPIKGKEAKPKKTRGITSLVYRSVRGVTGLVGWGVNRGLDVAQIPAVSKALTPAVRQLSAKLKLKSAEPYRETVRSAVNGVLGDTLAATKNPLAIQMQLRQQGEALQVSEKCNGKLLILIHGLCMNDLQWLHEGHDHGAMLSKELGYEPIYLHYNTGRKIHENGLDFAELLESTLQSWPVPITELVIIGHSMGGLVTRSACHHAMQANHAWVKTLSKLITLGTPHAGAPLERAGRGVDYVLGISPYTAPFARLGLVRSAGIQNLRDGAVTAGDTPSWPKHVKLYALACTTQKAPAPQDKADMAEPFKRLLGDGLVPVKSALAQEEKAKLGLPLRIPASRQAVVYEIDHFQMLGSEQVAKHLMRWLKA
jgi:pimeloyl-ACP methyl ester carboxylesterase